MTNVMHVVLNYGDTLPAALFGFGLIFMLLVTGAFLAAEKYGVVILFGIGTICALVLTITSIFQADDAKDKVASDFYNAVQTNYGVTVVGSSKPVPSPDDGSTGVVDFMGNLHNVPTKCEFRVTDMTKDENSLNLLTGTDSVSVSGVLFCADNKNQMVEVPLLKKSTVATKTVSPSTQPSASSQSSTGTTKVSFKNTAVPTSNSSSNSNILKPVR